MSWIANLLSILCPYCQNPQGNWEIACHRCRVEFLKITNQTQGQVFELEKNFFVYSRFLYEDWIKKIIGLQKGKPQLVFAQSMAQELWKHCPSPWKKLKFVSIPSRAWMQIHLVELLSISMRKEGFSFISRTLFQKRWLAFKTRKAQKLKTREERQKITLQFEYQFKPIHNTILHRDVKTTSPILLFDDVITTGSTLLAAKHFLEKHYHLNISGAVCLAYSQRKLR